MNQASEEILYQTYWQKVKNEIEKIKKIDIVVSITFFKETTTLKYVIETVVTGLQKYYPEKRALIFAVGVENFSNEGAKIANEIIIRDDNIQKLVTLLNLRGKGWAMRLGLETARFLDADIVFLDADLRKIHDKLGNIVGLVPETIKLILEPILQEDVDYVTPYYVRHKWDGTITNNLVYPLTASIYGKKIRQPIGGEIGISKKFTQILLQNPKVWIENDVGKYGVDIWITLEAIVNGVKIEQVFLTSKIHNPSEGKLENMYKEVANSLFHHIKKNISWWTKLTQEEIEKNSEVKIHNKIYQIQPEEVPFNWQKAIEFFQKSFQQNTSYYQKILSSENYIKLLNLSKASQEQFIFETNLWSHIVYDFIIQYLKLNSEEEKETLLHSMVPIYLGRTSYSAKITDKISSWEAEKLIHQVVNEFIKERKYLLNHLNLVS